jgi:tetratricopeptide (TPR) repeat protein
MRNTVALLVLGSFLILTGADCLGAGAISGLQVYSENDYARLAFTLEGKVSPQVETNPAEQLIFVRFEGAEVSRLDLQSYFYEKNPHLESVTFLPLGQGATVARIKARHPFSVKTFETAEPRRFVLELGREVNQGGGSQPASAPGKASPAQAGYYEHGLSDLRDRNYNAALVSFRNAIRAGDNAFDSYFFAGLVRLRLGEYENAALNFTRAGEGGQNSSAARLFLSWIYYRTGNYPSMLRNWKDFIVSQPDPARRLELAGAYPEIDYRALEAAVAGNGRDMAPQGGNRTVIEPVVQSVPVQSGPAAAISLDSAALYFEKGSLAREEGRLDEAAARLEGAVRFDPNYSEAYFQLGKVYKDLGRTRESAENFEKSLEADKRFTIQPREKIEEKPAGTDTPSMSGAFPNFAFPDTGQADSSSSLAATAGLNVVKPEDRTPGDGQAAVQAQSAAAGKIALDAGKTAPAAAPVSAWNKALLALRAAISELTSASNIPLLRRQVGLLTLALGFLLLLAFVGERVTVGRGRGRAAALALRPTFTPVPSVAGGTLALEMRGASANLHERKRQLAEVLARELATKQRAISLDERVEAPVQSLAGGAGYAGSSGLRPRRHSESGGIYGADIAHRIKAELSRGRAESQFAPEPGGGFHARRDDVKSQLIRQLRSKNWTLGDIAQELGVSREEVKWALAGGRETGERAAGEPDSQPGYGQASRLLERKDTGGSQKISADIDREVDLALQINV